MRTHRGLQAVACAVLLSAAAPAQQLAEDPSQAPLAAFGTAFTYQGQLLDGGSPANGTYDLQLRLFDALSGGTQVGGTVVESSVPVSGGLFTVEPDFTASVFTGQALWLDIGVRPGGTSGSFTVLSPRQPLYAVPFALYSRAGVATDVQCAGCVGVSDLGGGSATTGEVLTAISASTMAWQAPAGLAGSGSLGQVAVWSGTSALSGSNDLFWDGANARLGLGTTSPTQQLTLTGNLALPATTATAGQVTLGDVPFMHAYAGAGSVGQNTFIGASAGNFMMGCAPDCEHHLYYGSENTASGYQSLAADTTGYMNTAAGYQSLYFTSTGSNNTASGFQTS